MLHASATSKAKRKRNNIAEREHHHHHRQNHRKKIKLISETKTLTLKSHSLHSISNSFLPIQSSSSRRLNKKHSNSRKLNTGDCNRKWVFSNSDFSAYKDKIVVVSYNILGVENASKHPDLYYEVPHKFLDWHRRKELICEEINHYNGGILCFQEVDRFNDLDNLLQNDGFRGIYKARTGEAHDGCAIFWKKKLFTLLHEESIEFQSFGLSNNVAQFCILKMKESMYQSEFDLPKQKSKISVPKCRSLVVGNIHVLFNPKRGDIKLGQVRLFLEKAHELSQDWGNIPVIIGGDLNSIPQSALYKFLASSELDILLHDRRNISGQVELRSPSKYFRSQGENVARWSNEEIQLATGSERVTHLQHQLKLNSAYIGIPGSCKSRDNYGEPLATSCHSKFVGTVDYIWHTEELVPVKVVETIPLDTLRRSGGLPNERWGSDHLALVCEFAFTDDSNEN